jgi:hypothetical protein
LAGAALKKRARTTEARRIAATLNQLIPPRGGAVNKTLNLVIMILMAALAVMEAVNIAQNGPNARNVILMLLFAAFALRRFMIHRKLT